MFLVEVTTLSKEKIREILPVIKELKDLEISETTSTDFYIRADKVGDRTINLEVTFTLDRQDSIVCTKPEKLVISIVKPFDVSTRFLSTMFEEVNKLYVDENFVIMPIIEFLSPWPIFIETTQLTFVRGTFI